MARHDPARLDATRYDAARRGGDLAWQRRQDATWYGSARRRALRHDKAWLGTAGMTRQDSASPGAAPQARFGLARQGSIRRGEARQARPGASGLARLRRGMALRGRARPDRHGAARQPWRGEARFGEI